MLLRAGLALLWLYYNKEVEGQLGQPSITVDACLRTTSSHRELTVFGYKEGPLSISTLH